METVLPWLWLSAAIAVVAALWRAAIRGERRLARHWPDFHARWSGSWRAQHALAAAMAAVGMMCAAYAHGLPDGPGVFAIYLVWAIAAAVLAYLAQWIFIAVVVCMYPLLLPAVIGGLVEAWRHRRDPVPAASDWLPPGARAAGEGDTDGTR